MRDPFDAATMTPEERAREVSAILARGYLRHLGTHPKEATASTENALDGSGPQTPQCAPEGGPRVGPAGKEAR